MKTKSKCLIIILLSIILTAGAENNVEKGIIKGYIIAKSNLSPIEYAQIKVFSLPDSTMITGTTSSMNGTFIINNLPYGHYYVEIGFLGFNTIILSNITLSSSQKIFSCDTVILEESTILLNDVEIKGEKDAVQYQIDKKVIDVSKKLDASGGTVVNLLENTPSIQVDMEGNVLLRGSQNFTVLVDGKPSSLNSSTILKQIPAAMVERIEIITNPSAKYDAQGTTGIINIIMKKNTQKSTNGIIDLSVGTYNKYSGDFSINHQIKKVNLFFSGNYNLNYSYPTMNSDRSYSYNDTLQLITQEAKRKQNVNPYSINAGFDWNLNDKNVFTLSYDWGFWGYNLSIPENTKQTNNDNDSMLYVLTKTLMKIGGYYHSGNLYYKHNFKQVGDELSGSFNVSTWKGNDSTDVNEMFTNSNHSFTYFANHHYSVDHDNNLSYQLNLDYVKTIKEKHKLEAGYQGNYKTINSDYVYKAQDFITHEWIAPIANLQAMSFSQNIQAAYLTYSGELLGIECLVGLRGEYYNRKLSVVGTSEKYHLEKFDLFPSLHLSKEFPKQNYLQFSYSRRINRPNEWNLNPFPIFSDSYITQIGNPGLLPEYTHSIELNYMKYMTKGYIAVENYFHQTNNSITRTYRIDSTGTILYGVDNLNKNYAFGISLSGNYAPVKWFNLYANANLYGYIIEGKIVSANTTTRSFNYDFSLNTTFKMKYDFKIQLTGFYNAPKILAQGKMDPIYGCNLSLSKSFFKQRFQIVLTGRDIFNTVKYRIQTNLPTLQTNVEMYSEYPVVILQLSYKINNYKKKQDDNNPANEFKNIQL